LAPATSLTVSNASSTAGNHTRHFSLTVYLDKRAGG
jgi:hypothetical protein